jgi:hypothetical protein
MNEREEVFLKLQTGKTAVICELADQMFSAGILSMKQLDEIERRTIKRIKNADFAEWISDGEQIAIIESGIDAAQADFVLLRNRLRSAESRGHIKPYRREAP